ncbi:MAG: alpha/beta hydrolase [Oscillospiraceae bacterium]|nr:alpha/beta hydrolase [Oscillospiraceae bacterium]
MPSIAARVTDLIFRLMPVNRTGTEHDHEAERKRNAARRVPRLPKGVELQEISLNGIPAERLTGEGNDKGTVLYIHGGGFTTGSARERRMITQYIAHRCGYDCVAIDYRLAPENRWPAQIDDCLTAYSELIRTTDPADIVFMGESAGGTLVLALAQAVKQKGLSLPKAIAAFSPGTENSAALPSHTGNIKTDFMLRDAVSRGIADVLFDHKAGTGELRDPLISPFYGDYTGLPPVFLSASDSETLYDDTMILYGKLVREGHAVGLDIGHGVCHAYQIMTYMPEARRTLKRCFEFFSGC